MNSDFIVAVHAMIFLQHSGKTVSSDVLADNICTNPGRVRRVMAKLKKAGLVETHEGRTAGGYARTDREGITLGDISRALGVSFADFSWRSGDRERDCLISSGMSDYMDALREELDRRCRDYLETVTVAEAEHQLTSRKK